MENLITYFQNFNELNIDLVIANMIETLEWANDMDGCYLYGHEDVNEH